MRVINAAYTGARLSFLIFLASGITSIAMQQPLLMLVPFAWVLLPLLYTVVVVQPEKLFWLLCIVLPLSTELNITPQLGLDFPDELLLVLLTGIVIAKIIHQPSWFPVALRKSNLFMLLVIHVLWIIVTCFYSVEPLLSVKYLLAKTWFIAPLVILPQVIVDSQNRIKKNGFVFFSADGICGDTGIDPPIHLSFFFYRCEKSDGTFLPEPCNLFRHVGLFASCCVVRVEINTGNKSKKENGFYLE
jgi:hypothetical protein